MHNNGLVKFIAFFFTFVCVIQLSNTFFTNKIESDADLFSELAVNEEEDDFVTKRQVSKKLMELCISLKVRKELPIKMNTY